MIFNSISIQSDHNIRMHLLLCLKTRIVAPDNRIPTIMEAWLSWSLKTKESELINAGILSEFVAKPMPKVRAASTPINSANAFSSFR